VDAAAEAAHLHWMLEVEHLVVEQIFDGVARARGAVEDAADDDRVVGGVVVAEGALGHAFAPGKFGAAEQSAEEAGVKGVEDFFEIVEVAVRAGVALAASGVPDEFCLAGDSGAGGEALEARVMRRVDGLAVELGEQDMGYGARDANGRAFDEVGETDEYLAFAQADGGV